MSTQVSRYDLAALILKQLGIGSGWKHTGSRRALVAWMGPESGWLAPCDGVEGARFNPLNTTLFVFGGTQFPKYNEIPGVQNYTAADFGATAVANTLMHSDARYNYAPVIDALKRSFNHPKSILDRVAESGWGTFHHRDGTPNYEFVDQIVATYNHNRTKYNSVLVGP